MLVLLGCASMAAAQCTAPSANTFDVLNSATNCSAVATCKSALSTCQASATCNTIGACYTQYVSCAMAITAYRTNASSPCYSIGNTLYVSQLLAATASSLNGTALKGSCDYLVCTLQNSSMLGCNALASTVCTNATLLQTTATNSPSAPSTVALTVTLRIGGANWSFVLADPVKKATATSALLNDLSKLLGIDVQYLGIVSLDLGSLIVKLNVYAGSGKDTSSLYNAIVAASNSASWLTSTSSFYSTVGSDALTVLGVTVAVGTTTAASGSTPAPVGSAMSAAGVWAVAAAAAVAAFFA